MTEEKLAQHLVRLRERVGEDMGRAIEEALRLLPGNAPKADVLRGLQGRLNDADHARLRGTISQEDLTLAYNRIRADLLAFISALCVADFETDQNARALSPKSGHLLYRIPKSMPLGRESRCVVRLAYEEATIIRNIELDADITLKPIRIAEVMEVELVDDNAVPTFEIRTLSSGEQFVERGDYTAWIFKVKPLRAGAFPLVLRIAVLELVRGKERRKDIVLEETIRIVAAEEEASESDTPFKSTGILVGEDDEHDLYHEEEPGGPYISKRIPSNPGKDDPPTPSQYIPPSVSPPDSVTPGPKSSGGRRSRIFRGLSIAASIALLVLAGVWFFDVDRSYQGAPPSSGGIDVSEPADKGNAGISEPDLDSLQRDSLSKQ